MKPMTQAVAIAAAWRPAPRWLTQSPTTQRKVSKTVHKMARSAR